MGKIIRTLMVLLVMSGFAWAQPGKNSATQGQVDTTNARLERIRLELQKKPNDNNVSQSGTWNLTNISGTITLPTGAATSANQVASQVQIDTLNARISRLQAELKKKPNDNAVTQSGTWNLNNISGAVSLPTGASSSALQITGNSSLSSIDAKINTGNTSLASIDGKLSDPTTLGGFALVVGTTAVQVSSTSIPCKWVRVLNLTNGATVYYGPSTVTTASGSGAYAYKDGDRFYEEFDNLNDLWLISSVANTDVRITYGN